MYIKQIELENFKNFKDKTIIEFHRGLNNIFGPNGSGKSNILDSIIFVLGQKDLRIENDLQFFNCSSESLKSTVKIVFDNDNTVEKVLEKDLSSNIKTSYYLNGKSVLEDEILKFVEDLNLEIFDDCAMRLNLPEVETFADELKQRSKTTQIIIVSSRKPLLSIADKVITIGDTYYSRTLGKIYINGIKEDMNKVSKIAEEIGSTPENVLLYIIAERLGSL